MALQRPITKALTCQNCQQWILRSFMAAVGVQLCPTTTRTAFEQRRGLSESRVLFPRNRGHHFGPTIKEEHPLNETNAIYHSNTKTTQETRSREVEHEPAEEDVVPEEHTQELESTTADGEEATPQYIPWYLQAQHSADKRPENPLTARQRIPDLPEHSPSILQPLLEHVSVELGLDDLSILDLRSLDPPPALGANLFMIIGTARSEKHLHVSADRVCRWLRTTFKMRPYADGLLGRNELKLKMRRKAKRSKLFSAVGAKATADSEIDDGIRTGWVCVNLGKVEGGELPKTEEEMEGERKVVGFGTQTGGSNVVVQMMTEEKRGEIDLENLWTDMLRRTKVRKERLLREDEVDDDGDDEPSISSAASGETSAVSLPPHAFVSNQDAGEQLRV